MDEFPADFCVKKLQTPTDTQEAIQLRLLRQTIFDNVYKCIDNAKARVRLGSTDGTVWTHAQFSSEVDKMTKAKFVGELLGRGFAVHCSMSMDGKEFMDGKEMVTMAYSSYVDLEFCYAVYVKFDAFPKK